MLLSYLKVSVRRLSRDLSFVLINMIGLSFGLASSALVFLFVYDELTYDHFHTKADHIIIVNAQLRGGEISFGTPPILAEVLKDELPGVRNTVRCSFSGSRVRQVIVEYNNDFFYEGNFQYFDPSIFDVFSFSLAQGNEANALTDSHSIVISNYVANKYFPDSNPLGQDITIDGQKYLITGLLADSPSNSSIKFDFIVNYSNLINPDAKPWDPGSGPLYVLLNDGYDLESFKKDFYAALEKHESRSEIEYVFEPLKDVYLSGEGKGNSSSLGGKIEYIYTFSVIGFLILLMAFLNYVNLSSAKATELGREVGVRKVIGATRRQLILQYLGESIIMIAAAFLAALGIIELLLPFMNDLTGKSITLNYFDNFYILPGISVLLIVLGAASSIYTALMVSRISIVDTIKNKFTTSLGNSGMRRILLAFQYSISIGMIICALIVSDQLAFLQNTYLGFDKDRVININLGFNDENQAKFQVLKNTYLSIPGVEEVTGSPLPRVSGVQSDFDSVRNVQLTSYIINADANFFDFFKIASKEGTSFDENSSNIDRAIIINQAYADQYELKDPLGTKIEIWDDDYKTIEGEVIGVTDNFNFGGLKSEVRPTLIRYSKKRLSGINVRVSGKNVQETMEALEKEYKRLFPGNPFTYEFMDDGYDKMYRNEQQTGKLFNYFTILAIIISCMGLIGLTVFTVKKRMKEIGIRKVFGAGLINLTFILTKDFAIIFPLAFIVSSVISYLYLSSWLESFAFRVEIQFFNFAIGGLILLVLSYLSIISQTLSAIRIDPTKLLREE